MHGSGREGTRHLTARNEPNSEIPSHGPGFCDSGKAVVIGQGHGAAPGGGGQLDNSRRRLRAVRTGGVRVQVDHEPIVVPGRVSALPRGFLGASSPPGKL